MKLIYLLLLDTNAIRLYTAGGGTHEALSQSDLESKIESATQIQQKQYVETIKNNFEDFEVAFSGFGKELIDLDDQVQVLEEAGIDLPKAQLKRVSVPEIDNVDQTTDTNQKETKLTVVATQKPVPPIHKVTTTDSTTTVEPIGDVEPWKIPKNIFDQDSCTISGFAKCLNGGQCIPQAAKCLCKPGFTGDRCQFTTCGPTTTLINGTCDVYDLLVIHVEAPGIQALLSEQAVPIRMLSSKSSVSLGARDVVRTHLYEHLKENGPKVKISSNNTVLADDSNIQKLDEEVIGIQVEWFDVDNVVDAKLKISLPLGTGSDIKAWEARLSNALAKSMVVDSSTLTITDFDECKTQFNRCKSRDSVICENLPGNYQCRCLPSGNRYGGTGCQDACLTSAGEPYCLNNGRCKPPYAEDQLYRQKREANPFLHHNEVKEVSTPMCYCTENFHGARCQFEVSNDSSVLVTVWSISAVFFAIILAFLMYKIYTLVSSPAPIPSYRDYRMSGHTNGGETVSRRTTFRDERPSNGRPAQLRTRSDERVQVGNAAFPGEGRVPRHIYAYY